MNWLRITRELAIPITCLLVLAVVAVGVYRTNDPAGQKAMAAAVEAVLRQNGRLIAELTDRARRDQAGLTVVRGRYRAAADELAAMKASLAAQIKAPVQVVKAISVRRTRRKKR